MKRAGDELVKSHDGEQAQDGLARGGKIEAGDRMSAAVGRESMDAAAAEIGQHQERENDARHKSHGELEALRDADQELTLEAGHAVYSDLGDFGGGGDLHEFRGGGILNERGDVPEVFD